MELPGLPRLIPRPLEPTQPPMVATVCSQQSPPVLSVPVVTLTNHHRVRNQRKPILPRKRPKAGTTKANNGTDDKDLSVIAGKRNKKVAVCWPKPMGDAAEKCVGGPSESSQNSALFDMPWIKENKFKCGICNKHYNSKQVLKRHLNMHRGIYSYTCTICGKGYTSRSNLRGHVASQHTKVKEFKCNFCSTEFTTKYWLKDHVRLKHNTTLEKMEEMSPPRGTNPNV